MRQHLILLLLLLAGVLAPVHAQVYDDEPVNPIIQPEVYVNRLIAEGKFDRAERKALSELYAEIRLTGPATLRVAYWYNTLGIISRYQGNYRLALQRFQRALAIRRSKLGMEHRDTLSTLSNTALMLAKLGYWREAEPLSRQAYEGNSRLLGPNHANTVTSLSNLGLLNMDLGNYAEARRMLEDSLARTRKTDRKRGRNLATSLSNLAVLHITTFEFEKAEPLLLEALAIDDALSGKDHPDAATTLNNLGELYRATGRYTQAEDALLRALAIDRRVVGDSHPEHAATLVNIAALYIDTGRLNLAQDHIAMALVILKDPGAVLLEERTQTFATLAKLLTRLGRDAEAQALLWKAISIIEKRLGAAHPATAPLLMQLARTRFTTSSNPRTLAFKAHEIVLRTFGLDSAQAARSSLQVAGIFFDTGNTDDALTWAQQARTQVSVHFGTSSFDHAQAQELIARAALRKKRLTEATVAMGSAITGLERYYLPNSRELAEAYALMSDILVAREDWAEAFRFARKASFIASTTSRQSFMRYHRGQTLSQDMGRRMHEQALRTAIEAAKEVQDPRPVMAAAFEEADQLLAGPLSRALSIGILKTDLLDPAARNLVEAQAERINRAALLDRQYIEALLGTAPRERLAELRARSMAIRKEIQDTDRALQASEAYRRHVEATPPGLTTIQQVLKPGELLVMIVPSGTSTTVLAATHENVSAHVAAASRSGLATEVTALRRQLDPAQWTSSYSAFSRARAHKLYAMLLGPLKEELRRSNSLLLVTDAPLSSLPFATLVTRPVLQSELADSSPGPLRETAWLIRTHAVTSWPSLASLVAMRNRKPPQRQTQWQLIGIGAPTASPALKLKPLPQATAELDELKKLGSARILRQDTATEANLKSLDLSKADVIAFVTHAIPLPLKTDEGSLPQTALVLSAPEQASAVDDGLLTPTEIARLRLGPAWVVLSACNTAGDGAAATGMLARSFFQAGASAVLHTHWPVFDRHAGSIAMSAIRRFHDAPREGQAQALRKAMLEGLADRSHPLKAHPATWAAFSLVGEMPTASR